MQRGGGLVCGSSGLVHERGIDSGRVGQAAELEAGFEGRWWGSAGRLSQVGLGR